MEEELSNECQRGDTRPENHENTVIMSNIDD